MPRFVPRQSHSVETKKTLVLQISKKISNNIPLNGPLKTPEYLIATYAYNLHLNGVRLGSLGSQIHSPPSPWISSHRLAVGDGEANRWWFKSWPSWDGEVQNVGPEHQRLFWWPTQFFGDEEVRSQIVSESPGKYWIFRARKYRDRKTLTDNKFLKTQRFGEIYFGINEWCPILVGGNTSCSKWKCKWDLFGKKWSASSVNTQRCCPVFVSSFLPQKQLTLSSKMMLSLKSPLPGFRFFRIRISFRTVYLIE